MFLGNYSSDKLGDNFLEKNHNFVIEAKSSISENGRNFCSFAFKYRKLFQIFYSFIFDLCFEISGTNFFYKYQTSILFIIPISDFLFFFAENGVQV